MNHSLKISIGVSPPTEGIVRYMTVPLRERLMRRLFGDMHRVMVIVPGGSVKALDIRELPGGTGDE